MITLPFQPHCSIMVCGASASGKTMFIVECIKNLEYMFYNDIPTSIHYYYGIHQPLFDTLESEYNVHCHEGVPTAEFINNISGTSGTTVVILDDLMDTVTQNEYLCKLFTEGCHHKKICAFFVTQNLFHAGKYSKTIARNTHYFAFTKSPRNTNIVQTLASQVFAKSKQSKALMHAYRDMCENGGRDVLLLDLHPQSDDKFRIRSRIFSTDVIAYQAC